MVLERNQRLLLTHTETLDSYLRLDLISLGRVSNRIAVIFFNTLHMNEIYASDICTAATDTFVNCV
jgi:hypothetical protein